MACACEGKDKVTVQGRRVAGPSSVGAFGPTYTAQLPSVVPAAGPVAPAGGVRPAGQVAASVSIPWWVLIGGGALAIWYFSKHR